MTTRTTAMWALLAGAGLAGCMGSGPEGATMSALGACPDDLDGARCDADSVCAIPGTDEVCRCVHGTDGMEGHYECGPAPDPGYCDESVRTGVACDPSLVTECRHSCNPATTCRCVPSSDRADCTHVWLCEDVSVPPVDPDVCTEEHYRACEAGMYVECRGADGTYCRCSSGTDGDPSMGGALICDAPPPPPGPERCTDALALLCASGMTDIDRICIDERGWTCRCASPDRDPSGGLVCEPPAPPPTDPSTCDDAALERCLRGEDVRCVSADGRVCWCDPSSTTGFVCG